MDQTKTSRVEAVLESMRTFQSALLGRNSAEWMQLEITMAQLKALFALGRAGEATVGGLGEMLGIGLPAASLMVDKLVQAGLVQRHEDPEDRRRTLVGLTPKGRHMVARLWQGRRDDLAAMLSQLSEADFAALVQGL